VFLLDFIGNHHLPGDRFQTAALKVKRQDVGGQGQKLLFRVLVLGHRIPAAHRQGVSDRLLDPILRPVLGDHIGQIRTLTPAAAAPLNIVTIGAILLYANSTINPLMITPGAGHPWKRCIVVKKSSNDLPQTVSGYRIKCRFYSLI